MEKITRSFRRIKVMSLCAGLFICLAAAISAQLDTAKGGILTLISAVLFDTHLVDHEGWLINLHAGGFEGFGMVGFYLRVYYFLCGLAFTAFSLVFLKLRPAKPVVILHLLCLIAANCSLSLLSLMYIQLPQMILPLLIWGFIFYYIVFLCRNWRGMQKPKT